MQTQKRAILLLRSETGNPKDFMQQRKSFSKILEKLELYVIKTIESYGKSETYSVYSIALSSIRRHAVWRDYEYLLVPTINIFGRTPIEITEEIKFLENNGVKVISLSEGEISVENLPLVFRRQFKVIK